ncbi:hypothetical protein TrVE_jg12135 [Triparma verrucosa]|uniref:Major facilitator superfamily (MFS) profile domain-containing protein n=1 Tax=Triparma verrucosa TaxID=1606542 RepID=A0A9W7F6B4_9STRA|nr:hypothetical protein TrVE_jg12135 [Triparma verrucosa]
MSPEIGAAFFPNESSQDQLLYTMLIFSMSFLLHPLGALIFGEIADNGQLNSSVLTLMSLHPRSPPSNQESRISRNLNRTRALLLSFVFALLPTLILVILPDYNMIGKSSQYLLVSLRILQGIAVGGQSPGCHVLAVATSKFQNRGFRGSLCHATATFGYLLANVVVLIVRHVDAEGDWTGRWRVPFFVSILFLLPMIVWLRGIVNSTEEELTALYVQHHGENGDEDDSSLSADTIQDITLNTYDNSTSALENLASAHRRTHKRSSDFFTNLMYRRKERALERKKNKTAAVRIIFKDNSLTQKLVGHVLTVAVLTASFNLLVIFVPLYISEMTEIITTRMASVWTFITLLWYILVVLTAGRWNDRNPPRIQGIVLGMLGVISATPLMLLSIETRVPSTIFFAMIVHAAVLAFGYSGCASWQVEIWRKHPRVTYTGVALGHNISGCFFGGTLPVLGLFFANKRINNYCEKWNVSLMECYEAMSENHFFPLYSLGFYVMALGVASLTAILFIAHHPKTARFLNVDEKYEFFISDNKATPAKLPAEVEMTTKFAAPSQQISNVAVKNKKNSLDFAPDKSVSPRSPQSLRAARKVVTEFFLMNHPRKLKDVDKLLKKFEGKHEMLFDKLTKKYKLKPDHFDEAFKRSYNSSSFVLI